MWTPQEARQFIDEYRTQYVRVNPKLAVPDVLLSGSYAVVLYPPDSSNAPMHYTGERFKQMVADLAAQPDGVPFTQLEIAKIEREKIKVNHIRSVLVAADRLMTKVSNFELEILDTATEYMRVATQMYEIALLIQKDDLDLAMSKYLFLDQKASEEFPISVAAFLAQAELDRRQAVAPPVMR
jgi:hypothetical protein